MSRWRPANPEKSSPYVTVEGYARLKAEYNHLWHERRPEVVRAITAAAAEGDRSENAEYIYRKKELREIDRRVRYLQLRLPELKVVELLPTDASRVFFGATVTLCNLETGEERGYRIVGGDEIGEKAEGASITPVSIDSPLARVLLKKTEGDTVQLQLPSGLQMLEVVEVSYSRLGPGSPSG